MNKRLIQGLTLLLFVTSIGAFVAYRAGWFEDYFGSPNGNNLNSPQNATQKDSSEKGIYIMPSSKSAPLPLEHQETQKEAKEEDLEKLIMPSSKSGFVADPEGIFGPAEEDSLPQTDSLP